MSYKSVSAKVNINILTAYLAKKVNFVTIDRIRGVDHIQLQYVVFMLDEVKLLFASNPAIDICDLVANLYKVSKRNSM